MTGSLIKNDGTGTAGFDGVNISGAWFAFLVACFFLNDFVFIMWSGTSTLYLADYVIRIIIIGLCLGLPLSRQVALNSISDQKLPLILIIILIPLLTGIECASHIIIEPAIIDAVGYTGLFYFGRIDSSALYASDMMIGLALVAVSEELVFRKFALNWMRSRGMSALAILLLSAALFALMHWGSGLNRIAATFVFGVIAMAFYLRHTRLLPLITAHYLANFIAFADFD